MRGRAEGVYASKATIVQLDRCAKTGSAGASLHSYYWQATERWLSTWTLWVADPVTLEVTPGSRNHTRAVLHKYYHNTNPCKPTRHQHTNAISPSLSIQPTRLRSSLPPSQPTCHITRTHVHSHQHTHEQPGCPCWLRDSVQTYNTQPAVLQAQVKSCGSGIASLTTISCIS